MKGGKIVRRKAEHIDICLKYNVESAMPTLFEDVHLIHNAVPEINYDNIDLSTTFLGHKFSAPIFIAGMTGGSSKSKKINEILGEIIEELNIGMGVGSQRAALKYPELTSTYRVVRERAPTAFLVGNIGATQIINASYKEIRKIIDMIDADALAIHLNALQECIQPEGEPLFKGFLRKLEKLKDVIEKPIIIKEIGCGISKETAIEILKTNIDAIDVGGAGGTSFAIIESIRAKQRRKYLKEEIGRLFSDWGIPTAASILEVRSVSSIPLIATGGIRDGVMIAKALILGADLVGIGLPILRAIKMGGKRRVKYVIRKLIEELKITMFLLGVRNIAELKHTNRYIIMGRLREWIKERNLTIYNLNFSLPKH